MPVGIFDLNGNNNVPNVFQELGFLQLSETKQRHGFKKTMLPSSNRDHRTKIPKEIFMLDKTLAMTRTETRATLHAITMESGPTRTLEVHRITCGSHIFGDIPVSENSYEEAVLPPFVDALNSLASVAETLLASTDLQQGIQNVHQLLESSHKSLSKAEQSSLAHVKALSTNVEERLDMITRLTDEQKALQAREQSLNMKLSGLQGKQSFTRQQVLIAEEAVKYADDALDRAIQAWHDAEEVDKEGSGLKMIPIFGKWLGRKLIKKANEAKKNAEEASKEATIRHIKHQDAVEKYESELQFYREAIRTMEQAIAANTKTIHLLKRDLDSERELYQKLKHFLIPLRKCTSLLSILAGKTNAATMYMEFSGELDGLLGVLDEIVVSVRPFVESSADYSLLISDRLPTIIHKLAEANRRLKKAAASKSRVYQ
ncbi:uncharacterized protein LOC144820074 [Lissotriton helveticus]